MKKTARTMLLGASIAMAGPLAVHANELSCHCFSDLLDDNHWFTMAGNLQYACYNAGTCHTDPELGFCSSYHNACNGEGSGGFLAFDVEAAMRDRAERERLAMSSNVVYNPTRHALQIVGCDGSLIAHVPLDEGDRQVVLIALHMHSA